MKKDQRFLDELEKNLVKVRAKDKRKIIKKYRDIIDEEKFKGKKISAIIKGLGDPKAIAKKEIVDNKLDTFGKKFLYYFTYDFGNAENNKESNVKEKKVSKENKSKTDNKIEDNVEEKVEVPVKKERKKISVKKIIGIIILLLLLFTWLCVSAIFISSLFAILDGVKFFGVNIALFGFMLLNLWLLIVIYKFVKNRKINDKIWYIVLLAILVIIGLGVALFFRQVSKVETIKDVSDKYSFTRNYEEFSLPTTDEEFHINFNSNYNTKYVFEYKENMKNKVGIEVKYYECYYDLFKKKGTNSVYVSLKQDFRDKISVYIENLKENKVYDSDELSRYTVKIITAKSNAKKIVVD